jgi:UMF1 family MFS transporter
MYDFANSGYTTVVITAVFSAYFVAEVAGKAAWATFAWTSALAVSYVLVMITAPLVGAYADQHGAKKRLLVFTTIGCVLFTAALSLIGRGDVALAMALVILSNYFFASGENLIAAFLTEIADSESMGKVSGWGWSLGYLGGLVALSICLVYVTHAQARGDEAPSFVPVTMLLTAALFAVASLPTFLILRERALNTGASGNALTDAFTRVRQSLANVRRFRDLARFLVCVVFYQAGIQTVIALAAVYAQEAMGFTTRETLLLILIVNVTAAVGAFALGYVQDKLGHVPTLASILIGWIITVACAYAADGPALFWFAANLVGVCLGSSQSAGRALVGYLSPPDRTAEFFGLWGLAVKLSSVLGPVTYGAVTWLTQGNHRLAILSTGLFFVAGLVSLIGLDVKRGRSAALQG